MKTYYVHRPTDFGNVFSLYYVDETMDITIPSGWERITREKAIQLAKYERRMRRDDPAFAYRADASIYPANYPDDQNIDEDSRYELVGYIYERVE